MRLEAYRYSKLAEDKYILYSLEDGIELTSSQKILLENVRATKCIGIYNRFDARYELDVILDPESYYAIKGQLVNPVHKLSKFERSSLARIINLRDCIVRVII